MTRLSVTIAALAVALAAPVTAQDRSAQAQALIDAALAEHRVFLTCSSLEPATHAVIRQDWERMAADSDAILAQLGFPLLFRLAFRAASRSEALMPPDDTPFAKVRALCDANPDWATDRAALRFTILNLHLGRLQP